MDIFIGTISAFGFNYAPYGWAFCQGQILPISQNTALFAELTTSVVNQDNARWLLQTSQHLLHSSPEPRVIEKLLESARFLQEEELFSLHRARFREVYPIAFLAWSQKQSWSQTTDELGKWNHLKVPNVHSSLKKLIRKIWKSKNKSRCKCCLRYTLLPNWVVLQINREVQIHY